MAHDSTNLRAPGWKAHPIYPHVRQIVRVTGPSGSVYNGYVEQWSDKLLNFRDREPCYVVEPNGIVVPNGIYKTRLTGTYAGLPLYVLSLACCAPTSFSSSSVSTSSSISSVSKSVSSRSVSVASVPSVSKSSSSVSVASAVTPCFFSAPACPGLTVAPFGGAPSTNADCLTVNADGTLSGTFVAGGTTFPITITLNVNEGNNVIDCVAVINGITYHSDASPLCTSICFTADLGPAGGSGVWSICVIQDNRCCSSTSSSSVSSAAASSSSAAPSSSVVASSASSFSCCPNLPAQLGLFITCPSSASAFVPPPFPPTPGPPTTNQCTACAHGITPASWQFQSKGFFGPIFICFQGLWTLIQSQADPCIWISDPTDACQAKFTFIPPGAGCSATLVLTRGTQSATYKNADPITGCDCCSPIKMLLSSQTIPGCPDVLTITPEDCQAPSSASSSVASIASCACSPCSVCLTLDPTGTIYNGSGCSAIWQVECLGTGVDGLALLVTINGVTSTYFAQPGSVCSPLSLLFFNVLGTCGEWEVTVNTNTAPCSSTSSSSSVSAKVSSPSSVSSKSTVSVSSKAAVPSSSSSSSGGIATACCAGVQIPTTIHVTFNLGTPGCECLPASVAMTWNGSEWQGTFTACGGSSTIHLRCDQTGTFQWSMTGTCVVQEGSSTLTVDSCNPLHLTGDSVATNCCSGTFFPVFTL